MQDHATSLFAPFTRPVKTAGDAELSYALSGELYLSKHGWILLSVPNALVRGVFDAMSEPGLELPPGKDDGPFNAHISVIRDDELESLGGADKITERGHHFHYTLGPLRKVAPDGWSEMSAAYFIEIRSPELEKLRKSYGLTALPNNDRFPFHLTCGVKRKKVLQPGDDVTKISSVLAPVEWDKVSAAAKVDPATVRLEAGSGSTRPGGKYWHIHAGDTRAGHVSIEPHDEAPFGKHHSIDIHINQPHRGRGIGSEAYRQACEQSGHTEVIAKMRKNNTPSQHAAASAGFKEIEDPGLTQRAMRWTKKADVTQNPDSQYPGAVRQEFDCFQQSPVAQLLFAAAFV